MSDLNEFLASADADTPPESEASVPEGAELEALAPAEPTPAEPDGPTADAEPETPPEGLDKRSEAIWREERTKRKELQAQVDKMNDRWAQMVERMQNGQPQQLAAETPQQPGQPGAIEIPDFEEDPIGHLRAKNDLLERQLNEVNADRQMRSQQIAQVQQFEQLRGGVAAMEKEFVATAPDYHEAVSFLYGNVGKMASAMGYTPQQVQQVVSQTAMDITVRSLQAGKNPAQAAYEAAKAMGYAGPAPEQADNSGSPQRKPPTSLSSVAGKRVAGAAPTLDAISEMSDEDFDKMWSDMEKTARRG